MSPHRNDRTTTKLAAQTARPYAASAVPQDLELVVRYATPIVRLRVQECVDTFVALANAGFFGDTILGGAVGHAEAGRETLGELADDSGVVFGAWTLRIVAVGPEGLVWLARALELSGAHVEWWSVVFAPRDASSSIQPVASAWPFRPVSRRGATGYYVRLTLSRAATDLDETAFHRLVYLWMALVRVLPSRDGRGRSRLTTRPSYERGGNVLAVAGRELDVADKEATLCLFGAISRLHRETVAVVEALVELA